MHLPENTLLQGGKYKIVRFINAGGFGCTYEAVHVMFNKRVAIKEFFVRDYCKRDETTIKISAGSQNKSSMVSKLREKFIVEASVLNSLNHPNIVHVSDVFEENGTAYYVMDYIDGKSIHEILKIKHTIPEPQAVKYIIQVAEALKMVHAQGRLHLDIKPGNIIIDSNDNAVLIDFGASKQYGDADGENASTLLGMTPGYAPLEQMENKVKKFSAATDIYSLGATLYKMLIGTTPPPATEIAGGKQITPMPAAISVNVRAAVNKAIKLQICNRPQNIDEFLALIDGQVVDDEVDEETEVVATVVERQDPLPADTNIQQNEEPFESEQKSRGNGDSDSTSDVKKFFNVLLSILGFIVATLFILYRIFHKLYGGKLPEVLSGWFS